MQAFAISSWNFYIVPGNECQGKKPPHSASMAKRTAQEILYLVEPNERAAGNP